MSIHLLFFRIKEVKLKKRNGKYIQIVGITFFSLVQYIFLYFLIFQSSSSSLLHYFCSNFFVCVRMVFKDKLGRIHTKMILAIGFVGTIKDSFS